jgi:hypothetical protein
VLVEKFFINYTYPPGYTISHSWKRLLSVVLKKPPSPCRHPSFSTSLHLIQYSGATDKLLKTFGGVALAKTNINGNKR